MVQGPRGGEPERTCRDPVSDEATHLRDLVGRGGVTGCAALAHHKEPHGAVGHQGADVDVAPSPIEGR